MAPAFSRSRAAMSAPFVPADIILAIAEFLTPAEKHSMVLCCWSFHDIMAPVLYRHLDVWFQPRSWEESEGHDHSPYKLLFSLAKSTIYVNAAQANRCYARYVLTFRYLSHSVHSDLRALPLLTAFLRFAVHLRHLALDVCKTSVPLVIDLFRRHRIIRSPDSLISTCIAQQYSMAWVLPSLDSIRSPKAAIVSELMGHRNIRTAIIDDLPNTREMELLVGLSSAVRGSQLARLSLTLPHDLPSCYGSLQAITLAFPSLRFLSVRTAAQIAAAFFKHCLDLYALQEYTLPSLQFFSVNHTAAGLEYAHFLEPIHDDVMKLGIAREALETLSIGDAMWYRECSDAAWKLKTRVSFSKRAWADHRASRSRVCSINLHLAHSFRQFALYDIDSQSQRAVCCPLIVIMEANPEPPLTLPLLSTFELFLLSAHAHTIDAFFATWSPDLVLRLRQLSSSMRLAVEAYSTRCWDIDAFFGRWFVYSSRFLQVLDECGGIVSGSEAQQFFGRQSFRGRDLDIYVPLHGLLPMGRWLKDQGYKYHATADKHPLFDVAAMMASSHVGVGTPSAQWQPKSPPFSTFNFARNRHDTLPEWMNGLHVQLIVVSGSPIDFIVTNFHSTGVMNYITGKHAVSLFPRTTFIDHTSLICQDVTRNPYVHNTWIKKYRKRGFRVIGAGDTIPCTFELRYWQRIVGDSLTWIIPFDRRGMGYQLLTAITLAKMTSSAVSSTVEVPNNVHAFYFEVLPHFYEVAAAGAAIRVGPRFVYSSMAMIANPHVQLGGYQSLELAAAFGEYYNEDSESEEGG
ncbi:hypothetical protein FKP32DRAFT_1548829, partial [Trametes sanguinea]